MNGRRQAGGVLWITFLGILIAPVTLAQPNIGWHSIDGGGALAGPASPNAVSGTIAQPDAGRLSGGPYEFSGGFWIEGAVVVGVEEGRTTRGEFWLDRVSPNPFTDGTTIRFELATPTRVVLDVFDVSGRHVVRLVEGELAPGLHSARWAGLDDQGRGVGSGLYFLRFHGGQLQGVRRVVVIR